MKETKNKVKSFFKGDDTKQQSKTTKKSIDFIAFSGFRAYSF